MEGHCENCGRYCDTLVRIDDARASVTHSLMIGVEYEAYRVVCPSCAKEILGISDEVPESTHAWLEQDKDRARQFLLNVFKGRIAQFTVHTVLAAAGYEVHPFGYEHYLRNLAISRRATSSNEVLQRVRAMPDLLAYDRDRDEAFLLEVKSTSTYDETQFHLPCSDLDRYLHLWPETFLVVYCIRSGNIYCQRVNLLHPAALPTSNVEWHTEDVYVLDLTARFSPLAKTFERLTSADYEKVRQGLAEVFKQYAGGNEC